MTRILHVSEVAKAGVGTYLDLIWEVRDARHSHRAVLPSTHPDGMASDMPRITYATAGRGLVCVWQMIRATLAEMRSYKPDIVFLHSSYAMALLPLLWFARVRVVFCAHGWPSDRYEGGWKRRLVGAFERVLPRLADRVLNISDHEHRLAMRRGLAARSVMIESAALAFEVDQTLPDRPGIRLLFVGRFARQKGLDILLRAFAKLQREDITLDLVGGTVAEIMGDVGTALPKGVQCLGWMDRPEVAQQMAKADALIVPSRWEGFGLVIAESMSYGTPALVSNVGAMPDLVSDGETGIVFDLQVAALLACLEGLDKAALGMMRPGCKKVYEARFHPSRFGAELNALFEELTTATAGAEKPA